MILVFLAIHLSLVRFLDSQKSQCISSYSVCLDKVSKNLLDYFYQFCFQDSVVQLGNFILLVCY